MLAVHYFRNVKQGSKNMLKLAFHGKIELSTKFYYPEF